MPLTNQLPAWEFSSQQLTLAIVFGVCLFLTSSLLIILVGHIRMLSKFYWDSVVRDEESNIFKFVETADPSLFPKFHRSKSLRDYLVSLGSVPGETSA